jgi:hypothetical protein
MFGVRLGISSSISIAPPATVTVKGGIGKGTKAPGRFGAEEEEDATLAFA